MKFPRKISISLLLIGLLVLTSCGSSDGDSNSQPTDPPADNISSTEEPSTDATEPPQTEAPATEAPETEAPPAPTEEPTAVEITTASVTFEYVTELETSELMDPLVEKVEDAEGVLTANATVFTITITYDADIISEQDLREVMSAAGRPVKAE